MKPGRMYRKWNRLLLTACFMGLCMLLSACGGKHKWLFSINGENLYNKDVTVFGLIYINEHSVRTAGELEEEYDSGETYAQYYKNELEDEILSAVLLYKEAKEEGHELSKEEQQAVKDKAQQLFDSCDEDWIKERKLTISDVEKIYEWIALGDSYVKSVSQEKSGETEQENAEDDRYIRVYEVTFFTVEIGEDGMVQSNQDGTLKELSDDERTKRQEEASEFAEKAKSGADMETLCKSYGARATGIEKTLKYEDLDATYKRAVDSLSKGRVSGVLKSDYGYYVIKLLETEDSSHAEVVAEYSDKAAAQEIEDEITNRLFEQYIRDDRDYKNDELWDAFLIEELLN